MFPRFQKDKKGMDRTSSVAQLDRGAYRVGRSQSTNKDLFESSKGAAVTKKMSKWWRQKSQYLKEDRHRGETFPKSDGGGRTKKKSEPQQNIRPPAAQ